jgi:hypothetical protein
MVTDVAVVLSTTKKRGTGCVAAFASLFGQREYFIKKQSKKYVVYESLVKEKIVTSMHKLCTAQIKSYK